MIKLHRPYIYPNLVLTIGPLDIEYHNVDGSKQWLIGWRGEVLWCGGFFWLNRPV